MWRIGKGPFLKVLGLVVVMGSNPMDPKNNFFRNMPLQLMTGCHVAAHDWATWHLPICRINATCQLLTGPVACHMYALSANLPNHHQPESATSSPAQSSC
jgi:hypothetical protein